MKKTEEGLKQEGMQRFNKTNIGKARCLAATPPPFTEKTGRIKIFYSFLRNKQTQNKNNINHGAVNI